jgi:hypothetical protein
VSFIFLKVKMRQIFVDSRDRCAGTNSDFAIALPQTLSLNQGHQGRIDDLRLPNAIPTVSTANNKIGIMRGGSFTLATLENGNCSDGNQLASKIYNTLTREVAGNWVVTYTASRMELYIEHQYDFEFTSAGTFTKQLLNRPWDRYDNDGNWRGNRYTFYYVPLLGLDMCYLCCQNFSNLDNVGPKGSSDVLCAIPVTVGYGAVQHYSMSSNVYFDVPALTLQQLSFQLRDRDFNIVNSLANISFTLTID